MPLKHAARRQILWVGLLIAGSAQAQLIGQLQGTAHLSSYAGQTVSGITGIVTAVDGSGFWLQDTGDGNSLSSDAIYVFRSSASKPLVGDAVSVAGRVLEFRPGNTATNLTTTEISATASGANAGTWTRLSSGNALPAAQVIGAGYLPPRAISAGAGNVEAAGYTLDPSRYSMDFYESLEGMRVALPSAVSVAPRNGFGELAIVSSVATSGANQSSRGPVVIAADNFNGQRILIDDRITATPLVNAGAQLSNVTGVLDYSFGNYKLYLTEAATVVSNNLQREVAAPIAAGRLGIASYNVENLAGNADPARFAAIASQIATNLAAPQIISLQEIQDNNGATNNGVVAADVTLDALAGALNAQTGRSYKWVTVNPAPGNPDGGQPGGNIRQAFLYDSARVSFSDVVGGAMEAITASAGVDGQIVLSLGAGRIDPANAAFDNSRKPLVAEFTVDGQQLIVISNHFNSKGGDQPLYGPAQPPLQASAEQRLQQAAVVGSFVAGLLAIDPEANIVVTGDFNDFQFAGALAPLAAAGLVNLTDTLAANDRYSYIFDGNGQSLDHLFVSPHLAGNAELAYDIVHANSEFLDQVSDHDPLLLSMTLAPVPEPQSLALMLAGLLGVSLIARRRRG